MISTALRRLALAPAAALLVWLAAVNGLLLSGQLPELAFRYPERATLSYASAYSPLPGLFFVEDLKIRTQSDTLQLQVQVDHAWLWLEPLSLLARRVSIPAARGEGVQVRARHRLDGAPEDDPRRAVQPSIDGVQNPPDPDPEVIYPPPEPPLLSLSGVHLTELREVWIDDMRFVGVADLDGDLTLRPRQWLEIDDAHLALHGGDLFLGDEKPVASDLNGEVRVHLEHAALRGDEGQSPLSLLSGRVSLDGQVASPSFLNHYLRQAPWLTVGGVAGPLSVNLILTDGELSEGSELSVSAERIEAHIDAYTVSGPGTARWEVEGGSLPQCTLAMSLSDYEVHRKGRTQAIARGAGFTVTAVSAELALPDAFGNLKVELDMPTARIPDLSPFDVYLPRGSGARLTGGSGQVSAHFVASSEDQGGAGRVDLSAEGLRMGVGSSTIQGDGALHLSLRTPDLKAGVFYLGGSKVELSEVGLAAADGSAEGGSWWARATLPDATVRVGQAIFFEADVGADLKDSAPIVALYAEGHDLPRWALGLLTREDLATTAHLKVGDGFILLDPLHLDGEDVVLDARLKRVGVRNEGALLIESRGAQVGVSLKGSERDVKLLKAEEWFLSRPVLGPP